MKSVVLAIGIEQIVIRTDFDDLGRCRMFGKKAKLAHRGNTAVVYMAGGGEVNSVVHVIISGTFPT